MWKPTLTGPQRAILESALAHYYRPDSLAYLLRELDQDYDLIKLSDANFPASVAEVVRTAQQQNWLMDLLVRTRHRDPAIGQIYDALTRVRAAADPDPDARGDHVVVAFCCTARGQEMADELAAQVRRMTAPVQPWRGAGAKLRGSNVLVLVETPDAAADMRCRDEVTDALAMGLDVLAVVTDPGADRAGWARALDTVDGPEALEDRLRRAGLPARRLQKLLDRREIVRRNRDHAGGPEVRRIDDELAELDRLIADLNLRDGPGRGTASAEPVVAAAVPPDEPWCVGEPPVVPDGEFQDRVPYRDAIVRLLTGTDTRMVALTGAAGIGKTGLVADLLAGIRAGDLRWPLKGFIYLPAFGFRPVNAATLVLAVLRMVRDQHAARRLNAARRQGIPWRDLLDRALDELADCPVLIVIDNADELFETVDSETRFADEELREVVDLLLTRGGHDVRLLLVSQSTSVPAGGVLVELEQGLDRDDACAFLLALDADGLLGLAHVPRHDLNYLCDEVGGLPRALELVYAWLSGGSDRSLADLIDRFQRDTYDDVSEFLLNKTFGRLYLEYQRILQILAIYGRPVPAAAVDELLARYMPGATSGWSLARLARLRLIRREPDGRYYVPPRQDRQTLLDTVDPDGEVPLNQLRLSHLAAQYFARRPNTPDRIAGIEDLHDHLAEIDLRIQAGEADRALDLIVKINERYLMRWNYFSVAVRTLDQFEGLLTGDRERRLRCALAWAYSKQRRSTLVVEQAEAALALRPNITTRARLRATLGDAATDEGRYDEAARWYRSALRISLLRPDRRRAVRAMAYIGLGVGRSVAGDFDGALRMQARANRAMPRTASTEAAQFRVAAATNEGRIRTLTGDYQRARRRLDEAIVLAELERLNLERAEAHIFRSELLLLLGEPEKAVDDAGEAAKIAAETGDRLLHRDARELLALACLAQRDLKGAAEAIGVAVRHGPSSRGLTLQGMIAYRDGDRAAAASAFEDALALVPDRPYFEQLDERSLILTGLAVSRPEPDLLNEADAAFDAARSITSADGVVKRADLMTDLLAPDPDVSRSLRRGRRSSHRPPADRE